MSEKMVNYILHLSSYTYKKKEELLTASFKQCIINAFIIIFMEIYLAFISLPIFIFVPERKIKSKYILEEIFSPKLYFANFMIILGVIIMIVSFYFITIILPALSFFLFIIALFILCIYANYSNTWTNVTFKLSNYLFAKKQKLIESTSKLKSIVLSLYIVLLEISLFVVSVPIYIFIKPEKLKNIKCDKFRLRRKIAFIYIGFLVLLFMLQTLIAFIIMYYFYLPETVSFN